MLRWILIALAALAVAAIVTQIAIPAYVESRIEARLTENGGAADASVSATPALRLAFRDGDSLEVDANGVDVPPSTDTHAFDRLDGFDDVDIRVENSRAGPFALGSFELTRLGAGPYHLVTSSRTSGRRIADYAAGGIGGIGGALLRYGAEQVPGANREVPVRLDMRMESDDGAVRVVSGGGTIAGFPADPLAELITSFVAVQL